MKNGRNARAKIVSSAPTDRDIYDGNCDRVNPDVMQVAMVWTDQKAWSDIQIAQAFYSILSPLVTVGLSHT